MAAGGQGRVRDYKIPIIATVRRQRNTVQIGSEYSDVASCEKGKLLTMHSKLASQMCITL